MGLSIKGRRARIIGISTSLIILAAAFLFPAAANISNSPSFSVSATPNVLQVYQTTTLTARVSGGSPNCDYIVTLNVASPGGAADQVSVHLYTLDNGKGNVSLSYPGFFSGSSTSAPGTYDLAAGFTCGSSSGYGYGYGYGSNTGKASGSFRVLPPPHAFLTVKAVSTNGTVVSGAPISLSGKGNSTHTGQTPVVFNLKTNNTYSIQAQDFGQYVFDHWSDTGSTNRLRTVSILANTTMTAVYRLLPPETLKVVSVDQNGGAIYGYRVTLSQGGKTLDSGATSYAHQIISGQNYTVSVAPTNGGGCTFSNWQDTGSANPTRTVSITAFTRLTAVYTCVQSTVVIVTEGTNGTPINGLYTLISQNGTAIAEQCSYSTCAFPVDNGQHYSIHVDNFGNYAFVYWRDGQGTTYSWGGARVLNVPPSVFSTTITLVGVYNDSK